jgi:hypothetical protein
MMNRPRVSIGRLMAVIVVIALDCVLIRFFVSHEHFPAGRLAGGLILSAGSIALLFSRSSGRAFVIGFLAGALGASIVLAAARHWPAYSDLLDASIYRAFKLLPRALTGREGMAITFQDGSVVFTTYIYTLRGRLIVEVVVGLAIFVFALTGGLLALVFRRRDRSNPAPGPTPT